jgi:hypothetical protein
MAYVMDLLDKLRGDQLKKRKKGFLEQAGKMIVQHAMHRAGSSRNPLPALGVAALGSMFKGAVSYGSKKKHALNVNNFIKEQENKRNMFEQQEGQRHAQKALDKLKAQEARDEDRMFKRSLQEKALALKERKLNQDSRSKTEIAFNKAREKADSQERMLRQKQEGKVNSAYAAGLATPQDKAEFWKDPESAKARMRPKKRGFFDLANIKHGFSRDTGKYELAPQKTQALGNVLSKEEKRRQKLLEMLAE